ARKQEGCQTRSIAGSFDLDTCNLEVCADRAGSSGVAMSQVCSDSAGTYVQGLLLGDVSAGNVAYRRFSLGGLLRGDSTAGGVQPVQQKLDIPSRAQDEIHSPRFEFRAGCRD